MKEVAVGARGAEIFTLGQLSELEAEIAAAHKTVKELLRAEKPKIRTRNFEKFIESRGPFNQ